MKFKCPCCGNETLKKNPKQGITYEICNRCGIEIGYESPFLYSKIRREWEAFGKPFWDTDEAWQERLNDISHGT